MEELYGPYTVDLMASDAYAIKAANGQMLRHFTRCPMPFSEGVDIFAQNLSKKVNSYVFPPFGMIFPVISYLKEQNVRYFTCVIPYLQAVLVC